MTNYVHTQPAHAITYPLAAIVVMLVGVAFLSPIARVAILIAVPLALCAWMFSKLTVTIDEQKLRASFGPGLIYKDVPLSKIESAVPVRTTFAQGWGIHLTRFGWLYNVSGRDAVAIRLRDGSQLAIGTDQPEELAAAIRRFASAR